MSRSYKIGQIVPSSNVTMETEIPAMLRARELILPERFTFHSSRMRMKSVNIDELKRMDGESERCAYELSDANVDKDIAHTCQVKTNEPWDKADLSKEIESDTSYVIQMKKGGEFSYIIKNTDRSVGANISGLIAKQHGNYGMSDSPLILNFKGTAGQSFGVWNAGGLHLRLEGDANDYVGKGMASGEIIVYPPEKAKFKANESVIIGNTCMYGATGGKLYAAGIAGERFAVRNSGAMAIVEGVGDHGCEYMTNGTVIVLGKTGVNFGAGMSGGFAIVLDEDGTFNNKYNPELVEAVKIDKNKYPFQEKFLKESIKDYVEKTKSSWGKTILEDFDNYLDKFLIVKPKAISIEEIFNKDSVAA